MPFDLMLLNIMSGHIFFLLPIIIVININKYNPERNIAVVK
jgi:hypothetical protein